MSVEDLFKAVMGSSKELINLVKDFFQFSPDYLRSVPSEFLSDVRKFKEYWDSQVLESVQPCGTNEISTEFILWSIDSMKDYTPQLTVFQELHNFQRELTSKL
jgi:hypothetical protein